jgi:hypothetical protein
MTPGDATRPEDDNETADSLASANDAVIHDAAINFVKEGENVESVNFVSSPDRYCRYVPVTFDAVSCTALVDSGNVWRNAISDTFLTRLGLDLDDLRPLPQTKVRTAKDGADMIVLGETKKPLQMRLGNLQSKFSFRPVVLQGLGMNINISGPFLKEHSIDQLHSRDALRVQGHIVPLAFSAAPPSVGAEAPFSNAYVATSITLPPRSISYVTVSVHKVQSNAMPYGDGILEGGVDFAAETKCVPALHAMVQVEESGLTRTTVINPGRRSRKIKAGMKFGTFKKACFPEEEEDTPWRIAVMGAGTIDGRAPPPKRRNVLQQKLHDAIKKAKLAAADKTPAPEKEDPRRWTDGKKKEWLMDEFKLAEAPGLTTRKEREKAVLLLLEYFDVLGADGEYGQTHLMQHEIHTGDSLPIKMRHRPINPTLEPDLRKQLDKWEEQGVIEPSQSPWSFPLVAAPKKGGKIRWCVDYRRLNAVTIKDTFPLPHIEDNLARLSRSRVFSCLDGSGAFHVIGIKKEDKVKTAFSTPWGTYHYNRMPFGLCNGPASYSRLVQIVLHGIPGEMALPYLDDTIIHSTDAENHLSNLRKVLEAHRKAGLKLQPAKCQLFQSEVEYLGHVVGANGISPIPEYTKAVADWPLPTTRSEARTFLGKVGYYRRFIKDYSAIARPWTDVAGKAEKEIEKQLLEVTPQMKAAFKIMKSKLLEAPVLAYPRFDSSEPFILDTDWSHDANAVGGVLSQVQDGLERAILYGGKKMAKSQVNYSATRGELSAILHFVKSWKYYLQHRPFLIRTDHQPLVSIKTMPPLDSHMARWLDTLANYNFEIEHRAGSKHGNADALSRAPHISGAEPASCSVGTDEEIEEELLVAIIEGSVAATFRDSGPIPFRLDHGQLLRYQQEDEALKLVRSWLKSSPPDSLARKALSPEAIIYAGLLEHLFLDEEELVCYRKPQSWSVSRTPFVLCLPEVLWDTAIKVAHENGGHMGITRTFDALRMRFFWPSMKREITGFLAGCAACQKKHTAEKDQRGLLVSTVDGYPFARLSVDFVGPMGKLTSEFRYILTVRDTFTRWLEAIPLKDTTTPALIKALEREIFCRYGIPDVIHTDQGPQFTGGLFKEFTSRLGIKCTTTPAYNAKSNPVERAHQDIGRGLTAVLQDRDGPWYLSLCNEDRFNTGEQQERFGHE